MSGNRTYAGRIPAMYSTAWPSYLETERLLFAFNLVNCLSTITVPDLEANVFLETHGPKHV